MDLILCLFSTFIIFLGMPAPYDLIHNNILLK
jgi:hypothetical protein